MTVRLAAFGTQFNGRDVRLLASPADGSLSGEAAASIESFFYAAWKASHVRSEPYFAFIPLDHDDTGVRTWGLMQVVHLGRAAGGDVVVAWAALLDREQLYAIEWATHRLLSSAFPDVTVLPEVGTRLEAREAALAEEEAAHSIYAEAFDRVARALFPQGRSLAFGRQIAVLEPAAPDKPILTPETALSGVWGRLGSWREDASYCTWSGLEAYGSDAGVSSFRLAVGMSGHDPLKPDAIPLGASPDGAPLPAVGRDWEGLRLLRAGVRSLKDTPDHTDTEARLLAFMEWENSREAIRGGVYANWLKVAQTYVAQTPGGRPREPGHPIFRPALQYMLEHALDDLPAPGRRSALEYYIAEILPLLRPTVEDRNPVHTVAEAALNHEAIHDLSDAALAVLEPALFDMPEGEHDLRSRLVEALTTRLPETVNWPAFIRALRSPQRARPFDDRTDMMIRLAGPAWGHPDARVEVRELIAQLVEHQGVARALEMTSWARPENRADFFAAICRRRLGRSETLLTSWAALTAAMRDALLLEDTGRTLMKKQSGRRA